MVHVIKIECVGEGSPRAKKYGVWQILDIKKPEGFVKSYLKPHKDYTNANSVGTRGVFAYYIIQEAKIYEVLRPLSWNRSEHYYVQFYQGNGIRLTIDKVFQCLARDRLAKMY